ncbi:MAG TPA: glycosyltransferase family 4 protein [Candidatus Acidoferrales bacterium]|nr:glycosyltransferase family 4 protein [Candidatus Acidoferrales bacterium]
MKIAIISREFPPHGGGIGSWGQKASIGLARLGHEVHVITDARDGAPQSELAEGVHLHRVVPAPIRPRSIGWALTAARAVRAQGPFDLVQACEWDAEAFVHSLVGRAPLVTRLATPHFVVQRTNRASRGQVLRSAATRWMERAQVSRSRAVISPSRVLAREVATAWRMDPAAITIVPTGVETPNGTRGSLPPLLAGVTYALYFGRLEPRKGVDVWIDALPEVLGANPNLHAVLVGDDFGLRGRAFADYAGERCGPLMERVHFLPHLPHDQLFPIVAASSLVVLPSLWENLANTCLETMALGRPVLATNGSGFEEVLTDGLNGILVPPGDSVALARAACAALADGEGLRRMGAAARLRAADFTVEAMAKGLDRVYARIVA